MLNTSAEYRTAIDAAARRILPYAEISIIDPDIVYYDGTASPGMTWYSNPAQIYDRDMTPGKRISTLEHNYWLLDGSFDVPPDGQEESEVGIVCDALSDDNCLFPDDTWIELPVDNLGVLQAASISFTGRVEDGYGEDFTFAVYSGATVAYEQTVTGNRDYTVYFENFTAYNVTVLRVTFFKWSLPRRRPRLLEILPGIFEDWDNRIIDEVDVLQQTDFSNLTVTYGTARLTIVNKNLRFNPRSKNSIFQSIEERQGIPLHYGAELADGTVEKVPVGLYYQKEGGWKIGATDLTFSFDLVDIIGLVAKRVPDLPAVLPAALKGWIALIVSTLGANFSGHYIIDESISDTSVTANLEDVVSMDCGTLLRYVCMAAGAFYRADPETGYLRIAPAGSPSGTFIGLNSIFAYPEETANDELADITFKLSTGDTYTVAGTQTSSGKSQKVQNPFLHTVEQANVAARNILTYYGGSKFVIRGRGDMSCELGDVDVLETGFEEDVSARRYKQQLRFSDGVMLETPSYHLQATGEQLYSQRVEIAESGTWAAPAGVTEISIILVSQGSAGTAGQSGTWDASGTPGEGGSGGKIFVATFPINSQQSFDISITNSATTMGIYTSADGAVTPGGFGDIYSGKVYGLSGAGGIKESRARVSGKDGSPGTGNGGGGGSGGYRGVRAWFKDDWIVKSYPVTGGSGGKGGSGCAIIYYDDPEV